MDVLATGGIMTIAIDLIKAGYKVFPCNDDKTPRVKAWQKNATNDPATVKNWQKYQSPKLWGIPAAVNGFFFHTYAPSANVDDSKISTHHNYYQYCGALRLYLKDRGIALRQKNGHTKQKPACPPGQLLFSDQRKEEKALWKDC